jgi:hypothetical protein
VHLFFFLGEKARVGLANPSLEGGCAHTAQGGRAPLYSNVCFFYYKRLALPKSTAAAAKAAAAVAAAAARERHHGGLRAGAKDAGGCVCHRATARVTTASGSHADRPTRTSAACT